MPIAHASKITATSCSYCTFVSCLQLLQHASTHCGSHTLPHKTVVRLDLYSKGDNLFCTCRVERASELLQRVGAQRRGICSSWSHSFLGGSWTANTSARPRGQAACVEDERHNNRQIKRKRSKSQGLNATHELSRGARVHCCWQLEER